MLKIRKGIKKFLIINSHGGNLNFKNDAARIGVEVSEMMLFTCKLVSRPWTNQPIFSKKVEIMPMNGKLL